MLSGLNKTNKYSFHIKKDLCLLNPECVVMMSSERRLAALCMVEARVADPDPVGFETFWPDTGRKKRSRSKIRTCAHRLEQNKSLVFIHKFF